MAVLLSVVCDVCSCEYRPERVTQARADGPARARAAMHGWATADLHGVTQDVCPACLQQLVPAPQQAAERVLVGAAPQAPRSPAPVVHPVLVDVEVAQCRWCEDDQHQWCTGCDCLACR